MNNSKRVCLVVDAGYFIGVQRSIGSVDILKLKTLIEKKFGKVERSFYISSMESDNMKGFHNFIRSAKGPRMEVVVKSQKIKTCDECGKQIWVERGVDVEIATTSIKLATKDLFDTLVLVNGDSDLLSTLTYIRDDFRKEIIVCGELSSMSPDLQAIATDVLILSDYIEEIRAER